MALVKAGADVNCKDNDGYGLRAVCIVVSLVRQSVGADGPSTQGVAAGVPAGLLVWLCRWTALHLASHFGHTETAMALVKAGADVHSKGNGGYGCSGCIFVSVVCRSVKADSPAPARV